MSDRIALGVAHDAADFTVPVDGTVADAAERFWQHRPVKVYICADVSLLWAYLDAIDPVFAGEIARVYRQDADGAWVPVAEPHADAETIRRALQQGKVNHAE